MHRELYSLAYSIIAELLCILNASCRLGYPVFEKFVKIIFIGITECQYCARYAVLTELFALPKIRNAVILHTKLLQFKADRLVIVTVSVGFNNGKYILALCEFFYLVIIMLKCVKVNLRPRTFQKSVHYKTSLYNYYRNIGKNSKNIIPATTKSVVK